MKRFAYRSLLVSRLVVVSILAGTLLGVATAPATADVVAYREIFPHDTAGNGTQYSPVWSPRDPWGNLQGGLASANWYCHAGAGATNETDDKEMQIGWALGSPTNALPINSNPLWPVVDTGYTSTWAFNNGPIIYWSDEYDEIPSDELTQVDFYHRNNDTSDLMRVALRVGSAWYVSDQTFQNSEAGEWEHASLSVLGAQWRSLSFTPGSTMGQPGSSLVNALPLGTVTGFGVYSQYKYDAQRIDSFTLMIPEPSALVLGVLGFVGVLWLPRRGRARRAL